MDTLELHTIELDPLSDRYRVCPNCGSPHMVKNRGRDFCSDRCADQHYNAHRRLMKQAEPKHVVETTPEVAPPPAEAPVAIASPETLSASTPETMLSTQVEQESADTVYEQNIKLLEGLSIRIPNGTTYLVDDLARSGFDFSAYSGKGVLHNIDTALNCHFLLYGKYRIYRVDYSHVLITKVEPLKPKTDD